MRASRRRFYRAATERGRRLSVVAELGPHDRPEERRGDASYRSDDLERLVIRLLLALYPRLLLALHPALGRPGEDLVALQARLQMAGGERAAKDA